MHRTPFSHILAATSAFCYAVPDLVHLLLFWWLFPTATYDPVLGAMTAGYGSFLQMRDVFGWFGLLLFVLAVIQSCVDLMRVRQGAGY